MQAYTQIKAYMILPEGVRLPNTAAVISMIFGSLVLFFWLRDNFSNLTPSISAKVEQAFGVNLHLQADDIVNPRRFQRMRWAYVSSALIAYVLVCLLGVVIAQRSALVSVAWTESLPSIDSFPLYLAVAIIGGIALLPDRINLEQLVRTAMHEQMAIPYEIEDLKRIYYDSLAADAERTARQASTQPVEADSEGYYSALQNTIFFSRQAFDQQATRDECASRCYRVEEAASSGGKYFKQNRCPET